ncbi:GlcG/HbpS family heme-binding protein [Devosia enhydra]|uniref:GlcG/HbpS family heme-binding protein n=1 Tax=Devosia enhydra TaxID=665118 RepID=UPI001FCE100B|nr:heme-binding protein [Devosia enhydra]
MTRTSIDIEAAEAVIADATARASAMGVPQNIAVVDDAGHLVAFRRMDGAKFFSIEIAITKAFAASGARKPTKEIGPATQPGAPGFGAQALLGGRFTTLPGGIPLVVEGAVVGAIGVSSGSTAEDQDVAEAAVEAFNRRWNAGRPARQG